jgi:3-dehydroquinate synthase
MKEIESTTYSIHIGSLQMGPFEALIKKYEHSKKVILVDENTHDACLEYLLTAFEDLTDAEIMLLPAGEENKVMEVCYQVWEAWSEYKIGRKDLIINLGGGVVTDMGGFLASIFKRGLDFINIPTSLLAMVDASVGGKTGIDLGKHKNQLGVFSNPIAVFIDPGFLHTLPDEEKWSGLAEMLKHGLILDKNHWDLVKFIDASEDIFSEEVIMHSIQLKNKVVLADFKETGERKKLNFGHTVGHAIEGFFLHDEQRILHGHAVALGMRVEAQLSCDKNLLSQEENAEIQTVIGAKYPALYHNDDLLLALFELMKNDKKNAKQEILCTLLTGIGSSVVDIPITWQEFEAAMKAVFPHD